jgi:hypothetical protein
MKVPIHLSAPHISTRGRKFGVKNSGHWSEIVVERKQAFQQEKFPSQLGLTSALSSFRTIVSSPLLHFQVYNCNTPKLIN